MTEEGKRDRRILLRKKPEENLPVAIAEYPPSTHDKVTEVNLAPSNLSYFLPTRQSERKHPDHAIKAICVHTVVDDSFIVDMSENGLKIRGAVLFQVEQRLCLCFSIPRIGKFDQLGVFVLCKVIWSEMGKDKQYYTGLEIISIEPPIHSEPYKEYLAILPVTTQQEACL